MLETALMLPLFLLVLLGFIECARLFWIRSTMENALVSAGRFAMINAASAPRVEKEFRSNIFGLDPDEFTFTAVSTQDQGIHYETLSATRPVPLLNLLPGLSNVVLQAQITVPPPAGIFSCVEEQTLLNAANGFISRVQNDTESPIRLFWIDRDDNKLLFIRVEPGESERIVSVENKQPWMVADDTGSCLEIVVPWRPTPSLIVSSTSPPG